MSMTIFGRGARAGQVKGVFAPHLSMALGQSISYPHDANNLNISATRRVLTVL
jgi:hypothetical protein